MEVTINDISFMFTFYETEKMQQAVRQFIQICRTLESERCHAVTALVRDDMDMSQNIGPNCSIYGLIQKISDRVERSYFLSLLTGKAKINRTEDAPFVYNEKSSYACAAAAKTGMLVSPMDLPDAESQDLLDKAIWIKGRLYARKGVHNYAFQETRPGIFHCYIANDLGDDILTVLYKKKWD